MNQNDKGGLNDMERLDNSVCETARLSRDQRFDGKFYTAVITTGIFCRPICPARPPKPENVTYYHYAEQAQQAGFRPCKRCFPEQAPAPLLPDSLRQIIHSFDIATDTISSLAVKHDISERHLHRLFVQYCGLSPSKYFHHQRLLLARKLLATQLSITDICFAAGFNSVRRFNEAIKNAYQCTPTQLRRLPKSTQNTATQVTVSLPFRPPFDWQLMLSFLRNRQMSSVEKVTENSYARTVSIDQCEGWLSVELAKEKSALQLTVCLSDYSYLHQVMTRVRRIFDLDADMAHIHQHFSTFPKIADVITQFPGLRLPGCWDVFEFSIRAILGQQVSVKAATTLANRIAMEYGQPAPPNPLALTTIFPSVEQLKPAHFENIGLTQSRIATLKTWLAFYHENPLILKQYQSIEALEKQLTALKGIGPWTVNYIAMRGLSEPDAFPSADLGIIKALAIENKRPTNKQIIEQAQAWRPWRAYAAIYLWHSLSNVYKEKE